MMMEAAGRSQETSRQLSAPKLTRGTRATCRQGHEMVRMWIALVNCQAAKHLHIKFAFECCSTGARRYLFRDLKL